MKTDEEVDADRVAGPAAAGRASFLRDLGACAVPDEVVNLTGARLERVHRWEAQGFWKFDPESLDFVPEAVPPGAEGERLVAAVDAAIAGGEFAWSLRHQRSLVVGREGEGDCLFLHPLTAGAETVAVFCGLAGGGAAAADAVMAEVSLTLALAGSALDNLRLRKALEEQNARLEEEVAARTGELTGAVAELMREIKTRERVEESLRWREAALADAQRIAGLGSWEGDAGGGEVLFSAELCRILGRPPAPEPVPLEQYFAAVHPEDVEAHRAAVEACAAGGGAYDMEFRVVRPGGEVRHCVARGHLIVGNDGPRLQGIVQDVTSWKEVQAELAHAIELAQAADRAKSDFLAVMSHEIRTPLNSIIGFSRLLARATDLPARAVKQVQLVRSSGESLLTLINDILDLSKLEAGRTVLEILPFDPSDLLQEVGGLFTPSIEEKKLALGVSVAGEVPGRLMGDPARLRQVLVNLAGNAVKFTAKGRIDLTVAPVAGKAGVWRFEVRDTGPGIPEEAVGRLFQAFSQADASISRKFGGTGLGLAICRRLVELMGGRIGVTSTVGEGSCFWFEVRLPEAPAEEAGGGGAAAAAEVVLPVAGLRVLVVEDNAANRDLVEILLQRRGLGARFAATAEAAEEALREACYDVVFMDLRLPDGDGVTLARRLRSGDYGDKNQRVRVVALTANAFEDDVRRCREAGMDDHVSKPIAFDQFDAVLARARP